MVCRGQHLQTDMMADVEAEISPPHARGLLSGWTQLMIGFGFFVANWVGYVFFILS